MNKLLHLFLPSSCSQGEFACFGFCFLVKAGLLLLAAPSSICWLKRFVSSMAHHHQQRSGFHGHSAPLGRRRPARKNHEVYWSWWDNSILAQRLTGTGVGVATQHPVRVGKSSPSRGDGVDLTVSISPPASTNP